MHAILPLQPLTIALLASHITRRFGIMLGAISSLTFLDHSRHLIKQWGFVNRFGVFYVLHWITLKVNLVVPASTFVYAENTIRIANLCKRICHWSTEYSYKCLVYMYMYCIYIECCFIKIWLRIVISRSLPLWRRWIWYLIGLPFWFLLWSNNPKSTFTCTSFIYGLKFSILNAALMFCESSIRTILFAIYKQIEFCAWFAENIELALLFMSLVDWSAPLVLYII